MKTKRRTLIVLLVFVLAAGAALEKSRPQIRATNAIRLPSSVFMVRNSCE